MTLALADFADLATGTLWGALLVFLRIGAMMALIPAFGEQSVPARVKLGLTVAFTLIVLPATAPHIAEPPNETTAILGLAGAEIVSGLFFGMMLRLFIMALQIAGTIAAQSTSLSQLFGGSAGADPLPAMGHVLVISGLALAALLGLHVRVAAYMLQSYDLVPIGVLPMPGIVAEAGVAEVTRCFSLGFTLAAPFVVASLLYNVTLGVINRAMPQLMVAFVGAPAITAGGLALLMISAPFLLSIWSDQFFGFMARPFGPIQ
ncbi:flagellar biosynthetic protein FliR [Flavimaricola marinus]|uniref:Flagellar biosynthesis protein FliR n=1 Tax=Flavimaricola marinus TaxID=1819565 RepID=A0A238LGZ0_9RHOB|nr:flagellar biosynthetic protein FliR [Flavimaricola marinus]SMY08226.1 flagellar biosynthesis protein FliR [Flavimaricola marinus]